MIQKHIMKLKQKQSGPNLLTLEDKKIHYQVV